MTTWQRCTVLLALFWPAIRHFGIERPFLVSRFPIAPSVPTWIDGLLDLPLIVAMIVIGFTTAPRRAFALLLLVVGAHTALIAVLVAAGSPYYSGESLWDVRLFLLSFAYGFIYLGAPVLLGFLARRIGIGVSA